MAGATPFTTCEADRREIARLRIAESAINPGKPVSQTHVAAMQYWLQGLKGSVGNAVIAYDYGVCAFADMADAIATATEPTHKICVLGWWVDPFTRMKDGNGGLLSDLLSASKAEIRGMFWSNKQNGPITTFLNARSNGAAILDNKLPFARLAASQSGVRGGIHHQKLLVVSGSSGLIAFAGGMDINPSRVNVTPGGIEPLHDVQLRLIGPEAANLLKVFSERWLDHPDSSALDQTKFKKARFEVDREFTAAARSGATPDLPTATRPVGTKNDTDHAVTVGRTYANLPKFTSAPQETYSFAPSGEQTAWKIVQSAIQRARQFIYIEDQYFVSRRVKAELVKKLQDPAFQFLLVLMQDSSSFESSSATKLSDNEFPYLIAARNEIRTDLLAADPKRKKWGMYTLRASADPNRQKFCGSYVHSKIMLMDDDFAVIGSANVDDRGYTFDTEIVVGVTDDPQGRASRQHFAQNLRLNLWHKHLGVGQAWLFNWRKGLGYWLKPPPEAMIVDGHALEDSPLLGLKPVLRNFPQEDRLWRETIDPDADKLP
jgi:phosphatidylserine/phosphatidylglycerophosphate/cardiolipin synthase-like enzyme